MPEFDLTGTARSLLNIEANTILRDEITGEPMPPVPHALLDIAGEYARALCSFGVDLQHLFVADIAALPTVEVPWLDRPSFDSAILTIDPETFDRLRWAAKGAAQTRRPNESAALGSRAVLDRIVNNSDAIKEIFKRLGPSFDQFRGKTRADLGAITIQRGSYSIDVNDLVTLQKIWDIGVEQIIAQTVVHITGDVTTRVQLALTGPGGEPLFAIHRQTIDISVSCWRYLLDVIREIAGVAIGTLLGRPP
jgi:hypothetical protein